jgi:hypothetical protein
LMTYIQIQEDIKDNKFIFKYKSILVSPDFKYKLCWIELVESEEQSWSFRLYRWNAEDECMQFVRFGTLINYNLALNSGWIEIYKDDQ